MSVFLSLAVSAYVLWSVEVAMSVASHQGYPATFGDVVSVQVSAYNFGSKT